MTVDEILERMSKKVDKSKSYLKGLFNKEKASLVDSFGDALDNERINMLSMMRVGKKYDLTKIDIDMLTTDDAHMDMEMRIIEEDEELIEIEPSDDEINIKDLDNLEEDLLSTDVWEEDEELVKEVITEMKEDIKTKGEIGNSAWNRFLQTVPEPVFKTKEFERTPSLIIEIGPTYYLKIADLDDAPYEHEFEGKYGDYTKTACKVILIKVSDEDLYSVKFKKGEFEGQPAFVNGSKYTLWLDEKAMGFFKLFWKKVSDTGGADNRVFTFKQGKKANYNVWKFGLPKK